MRDHMTGLVQRIDGLDAAIGALQETVRDIGDEVRRSRDASTSAAAAQPIQVETMKDVCDVIGWVDGRLIELAGVSLKAVADDAPIHISLVGAEARVIHRMLRDALIASRRAAERERCRHEGGGEECPDCGALACAACSSVMLDAAPESAARGRLCLRCA